MSGVPWIIWRCKFESETASSSTMPRGVSTPAAARYISAAGARNPVPTPRKAPNAEPGPSGFPKPVSVGLERIAHGTHGPDRIWLARSGERPSQFTDVDVDG